MANHKSAKKRAKQNQVRRMRNKSVKTSLKTLEKK
ncbi:MAG TPA: 30S ribosomal protein S20, partial [Desulfobacter postgatei]|nr:30S ribosomal protein S20 [Desulfobacter postgatei]